MFSDKIPVIDLFAGPGGLAEGFSAYKTEGKRIFKIGLSIEKDRCAHSTLELRSFFRQFQEGKIPPEYYAYLRKEISREMLFASYPAEARNTPPAHSGWRLCRFEVPPASDQAFVNMAKPDPPQK